jgi:hypothetical protein
VYREISEKKKNALKNKEGQALLELLGIFF